MLPRASSDAKGTTFISIIPKKNVYIHSSSFGSILNLLTLVPLGTSSIF